MCCVDLSGETHQWADGLLEGGAEHVAEDQKGQPLALLQTGQQSFNKMINKKVLSHILHD